MQIGLLVLIRLDTVLSLRPFVTKASFALHLLPTNKFRRKIVKNLQRYCAAMVLTLALALSVFAGQIPTPGVTNPTPQQESSVTDDMSGPGVSAMGQIPTPGVVALDPVTEAVFSLLQGLMSLF